MDSKLFFSIIAMLLILCVYLKKEQFEKCSFQSSMYNGEYSK